MNGDHRDLVDRLDQIVADLDERSFDLLREASAAGRGRPDEDRKLAQARRAVEKAAHLLRGTTGSDDD